MSEVLSIYVLTREQIVQAARQQADAGEPCNHGFEPGSTHACTWERTYHERLREVFDQRAEV